MRTDSNKGLFTLSALTMAVFVGIAGGLTTSCDDSESSTERTLANTGPPSIDLLAPDTYKTATFAFG